MKMGIFTNFINTLILIFYLGTCINKNLVMIFSNISMFLFSNFDIFRLVSGIFVSENIIEAAMNILISNIIINYYEMKEGTIKTFLKVH